MFSVLHPVKDRDRWSFILDAIGPLAMDPHFSPWYLAAEEILGGRPLLAVWEDTGGHYVAKPVVLRDVVVNGRLFGVDATSPHGYGGPVSNHGPVMYDRFDEAFTQWCCRHGVICEYTALNPMQIDAQRFLMHHWVANEERTRTALTHRKDVVFMDIATPAWNFPGTELDLKRIGYHDNRIAGIKAARKVGITVSISPPKIENILFATMYEEAMDRKGAADRWRFPREYLLALCGGGYRFYATTSLEDGNDAVAAALAFFGGRTAYYHMAANRHPPVNGANELLVHQIAVTARAHGCYRLHLGGGVTSATDDGVLFFKSGFSDLRAPAYSTFRVFDQPAYRAACEAKQEQEIAETGAALTTKFEPLYRREAA